MLDIRYIRQDPKEVQKKSEQKGYKVDIPGLLKLDDERRELQTKAESLRQARNELADGLKAGKPSGEQLQKGRKLKTDLAGVESHLETVEKEFLAALKKVPNMPLDYVPVGKSEEDNKVVKTVGEPTKFAFKPKNHWQIAEERGLIDKERAAKITGSRFAYVKGNLVRLQFALMQWVMDVVTDEAILQKLITDNNLKLSPKAFVPVIPPALVRTDVYEATGRLNAEEQTYKLADDELWLNASAEHSLCPMYMNEILPEADLPIRYLGYSTSFRREAGSYGKDMEGVLRMHQFDKLEMESFSLGATGLDEHKLLIAVQEHLMQQLQIPYQLLQKCTFDIGGPNAAGVDINAWLPGQNQYRETHTADYMTDYQSRRLQTRVRRENGEIELVHTNDATALAMGRGMVAIIENYQQEDGGIIVPEVLRPYLGSREVL